MRYAIATEGNEMGTLRMTIVFQRSDFTPYVRLVQGTMSKLDSLNLDTVEYTQHSNDQAVSQQLGDDRLERLRHQTNEHKMYARYALQTKLLVFVRSIYFTTNMNTSCSDSSSHSTQPRRGTVSSVPHPSERACEQRYSSLAAEPILNQLTKLQQGTTNARTLPLRLSCPKPLLVARQVLAKQLLNSLIGAGWFSDPRGSAGFMHFTSDFMEYLWCSLTLRPRPASQEAIQASKNPPTRGSGDGIVVRAHNHGILHGIMAELLSLSMCRH